MLLVHPFLLSIWNGVCLCVCHACLCACIHACVSVFRVNLFGKCCMVSLSLVAVAALWSRRDVQGQWRKHTAPPLLLQRPWRCEIFKLRLCAQARFPILRWLKETVFLSLCVIPFKKTEHSWIGLVQEGIGLTECPLVSCSDCFGHFANCKS